MREFDFLNTPIVDIVNEIIIDSVKRNASDIHFDPMENYLKIRIRIDGSLIDYAIIENKYKRNLVTRVKLLAGMNITESRLPQDGAIKTTLEGIELDMRVSALPTSFGEKIVIRILDYSMSLKGLETLGFTDENYKLILKMIANPNGIILVTGATGSGKSTTVYSILQRLNREETNIITVEDPVEMNIEGINQVQVNPEIGLDFASVLRSILRQDPNIVLIGEIRDSETAKIAVRASITGHLVLSTLHTNNSLTTIERLIDMDVERYLLASSLKGIISQTLAKRLCKKCAKKRPTTEAEKKIFKKSLGIEVDEVYEPGKCEECHNGYKGRIALQEVLLINEEIRDAINKNEDRHVLRKLIYQKGVKTLLQDGLIKIMNGITTFEEVFKLVDLDDDVDDVFSAKANEFNTIVNDAPLNIGMSIMDDKLNDEVINKSIDNARKTNNVINIPSGNDISNVSNDVEPVKTEVNNNIFDTLRVDNIDTESKIEDKVDVVTSDSSLDNDAFKVDNSMDSVTEIKDVDTSSDNSVSDTSDVDTSDDNNVSDTKDVDTSNDNSVSDNNKAIEGIKRSSTYTDELINLINQDKDIN
jgi:type II secretory ATPase GspE/PulE/Tfp pilus assembly ATPase PilB-like protein